MSRKKYAKLEKYSFRGTIWKSRGLGGWHFVTLPKSVSVKIRKNHGRDEEGWGRLKATAVINETEWTTAIWFDTKAESYLLPVKTSVRKAESLAIDSKISGTLILTKENSSW